MAEYLYCFLSSAVICAGLLEGLRRAARRFRLIRSRQEIPSVGGAGLFFAVIVSLFAFVGFNGFKIPFQFAWIIIFALILLILETVDDFKNFSLKTRIIAQAVFIVLFLFGGKGIAIYFIPGWANYLLSFFWVAGITNAFNLLDIADGLCAGVSLVVCSFFLLIALAGGSVLLSVLLISLLGAIFAFLFFNFPPAKVYLGNAGSHFIGFLFAALAMYGDYAGIDNRFVLIFPLFILAFPIIDTFLLMFIRFKKGITPLRKSNDHVFFRLLFSGYNNRQALAAAYLITFLWGAGGVLIFFQFYLGAVMFLILAVFFTLKLTSILRRQ